MKLLLIALLLSPLQVFGIIIDFSSIDESQYCDVFYEEGFVFKSEWDSGEGGNYESPKVAFVTSENGSIFTGYTGIQTAVSTRLVVEREDGRNFDLLSVDGAMGDYNWDSAPFDFHVAVSGVFNDGTRQSEIIVNPNIEIGQLLTLQPEKMINVNRLEFSQGAIWHQYTNFNLRVSSVSSPGVLSLYLLIGLLYFASKNLNRKILQIPTWLKLRIVTEE